MENSTALLGSIEREEHKPHISYRELREQYTAPNMRENWANIHRLMAYKSRESLVEISWKPVPAGIRKT